MTLPKPAARLATDSHIQTPPPGLRWNFLLHLHETDTALIVETARRENNILRFKLPQLERLPGQNAQTALNKALTFAPYSHLFAIDATILQESSPFLLDLPFQAQEVKKAQSEAVASQLEIVYVQARLRTKHPFIGYDFLQPMLPAVLLTKCQSYRQRDYTLCFTQFGLL